MFSNTWYIRGFTKMEQRTWKSNAHTAKTETEEKM